MFLFDTHIIIIFRRHQTVRFYWEWALNAQYKKCKSETKNDKNKIINRLRTELKITIDVKTLNFTSFLDSCEMYCNWWRQDQTDVGYSSMPTKKEALKGKWRKLVYLCRPEAFLIPKHLQLVSSSITKPNNWAYVSYIRLDTMIKGAVK